MVLLGTYVLLLIGISRKAYKFLIPHIFFCFSTIFVLIIDTYIEILRTAGTRDAVESYQIIFIANNLFVIIMDLYLLIISWRTFTYICDFNMALSLEIPPQSSRYNEVIKLKTLLP
ncbi:unnamed protein product [Dracunculus medinensis]|uniref:G_PROTEIN_RECEP_F1_2 domain-containing protein n=1 Tax=Dracunculus medinensis TaxID=318479 RepID=A0A0N4U3P9_DRAME|nr:unnamed protein product [Dracunculus medinensis]